MNDRAPQTRRSRNRPGGTSSERSTGFGRPAPRLLVDLTLEELPRVSVDADTFEDQVRILVWAINPATIQRFRESIADALDELREAA